VFKHCIGELPYGTACTLYMTSLMEFRLMNTRKGLSRVKITDYCVQTVLISVHRLRPPLCREANIKLHEEADAIVTLLPGNCHFAPFGERDQIVICLERGTDRQTDGTRDAIAWCLTRRESKLQPDWLMAPLLCRIPLALGAHLSHN
jgi:hypothetical protein